MNTSTAGHREDLNPERASDVASVPTRSQVVGPKRSHPGLIGALLWIVALAWGTPVPAAPAKPVLLYCRHYNAAGETRYLPDGTFRTILARLAEEYEVRVSGDSLTPEVLASVQVILIANPSERAVGANPPPPRLSDETVRALVLFVERGGGVIVTGNQEDHNLETERFNVFLAEFGLRAVNRYTDAKLLRVPSDHPVLGGLRWAYYTGNQVQTLDRAPAGAKPRCLVANDLLQKTARGTRDEPGCLLAGAERGRGRVLYVTDSGWLADPALDGTGIGGVSFKEHDNLEICRRLIRWVRSAIP